MLVITAPLDDGRYDLIVVLEDENIQRLWSHDPAELPIEGQFNKTKLRSVQIAYATPEEMKRLTTGPVNFPEVTAIVFRGWKYRPESGDHDQGPQRLHGN